MTSMIWAVVVAAGIPSALIGILIGRLNRRIEARDKAKDEKEQTRVQYETMMIELSMVSLALGEATAEAVQRIPDTHCNGDMHSALEFARNAKAKYRRFEQEQTAKSIHG